MKKSTGSKLSSESNFNTLGLSGTNNNGFSSPQPNILVYGKGTDQSKEQALQGRAKRKIITQTLMLSLIDIAKEKGAKDRVKSYWNTYRCQSYLVSGNGKLHGRYCRNRFCNICCSIRKAELINTYYPIINTWDDLQFVTLTVQAVKAHELYDHVRKVKNNLRKVIRLLQKRYSRKKKIPVMGIKSLECNYNPVDKTYNPHFHIIVPGKDLADRLFWEWRKKWAKGQTSIWAQKIRKIENTEKDMIETIKYGAKIFTSPDMKKNSKLKPKIYAAALDNIHAAFSGIHIFDSFGFKLPKKQDQKSTPKLLANFEEWGFHAKVCDWVNMQTGELLSNFQPTADLEDLLENNIDSTSI